MTKPIYVEIVIQAPVEVVWEASQRPDQHVRWDARFTSIEYLPRAEGNPQRFRYATRLGFGIEIRGEGETSGERDLEGGSRASSLTFGSEDPWSLIASGSGYWKYVPVPGGTRFITGYDYQTRNGFLGRSFDAAVFRPLMGWATAWSFDRLRLWIERGIAPESSMRLAIIHTLARLAVAFAWIYQGLVPKILRPDTGELEIFRSTGIYPGHELTGVVALGIGQALLGLAHLVAWRSRVLLLVGLVALGALGVGGFLARPDLFVLPFNPATLIAMMIALSLIDWTTLRDLPSARTCLRRAP
jgi:hypothetical protein